jgi:hypothetical protein
MPGEAQTFDEGGDSDSQINCIAFFFYVQSRQCPEFELADNPTFEEL